MPTIIIIAGPNGAGKTTFANEYLSPEHRLFKFVNADEIARQLAPSAGKDIRAGRLMLERIDALAATGVDFALETTLATLTYAQKITRWRTQGYKVILVYLRLPSVEASIARVGKRAQSGGHAIPETTIRRRFDRSWRDLEMIYKPIVDEWSVWDSLEGRFVLTDSWKRS